MQIDFACSCGQRMTATEQQAGQRGQCPACGAAVVVPGQAPIVQFQPSIASTDRQQFSDRAPSHTGDLVYPSSTPKDPVLMAILSCLCVSGLGQLVLGQVIKGVVMLLVSMVVAVITAGLSVLVTLPVCAIDAFMVAKKLKTGRPVGQWEFFPQ